MRSTLRLVPRARVVGPDEPGKRRTRFLDLVVDGAGTSFERARARLLGAAAPDLAPDRVALFVCPECGDLDCGALTVRLVVAGDVVRWDDWAWQTDDDPTHDRSQLHDMVTSTFDRAAYEATLRSSGE